MENKAKECAISGSPSEQTDLLNGVPSIFFSIFINYVDAGSEEILIRCASDTKLGEKDLRRQD